MVAALTPFAFASPANSCFQAGKPATELPHCAASAREVRHASKARVTKVAVTSFLLWVIKEVPRFCGAVPAHVIGLPSSLAKHRRWSRLFGKIGGSTSCAGLTRASIHLVKIFRK